MYTTSDLLEMVKLRGTLPKGSFSDAELLLFATDAMRSTVVPFILQAREDFFVTYLDFAPTSLGDNQYGPFQIPERAIGAKIRHVVVIDGSGNPVELSRVELEDLPFAPRGWWFQDNQIYCREPAATPTQIRIYYFYRTNSLVPATEVGIVQSFSAVAKTITLVSAPSGFTGETSFDLVKSRPTFDLLAADQAGTLASSTITFSAALPSRLAVGDQVSLAGESAVIQLPVEFHPVLAQSTVCLTLEAIKDREGLELAQAKLQALAQSALNLITQRAERAPKFIVSQHSPWRRRW